VMRGTFPRMHRVSSKGWYHEGDKERDSLRSAIAQALGGGRSS
jgi:hypothetical protein